MSAHQMRERSFLPNFFKETERVRIATWRARFYCLQEQNRKVLPGKRGLLARLSVEISFVVIEGVQKCTLPRTVKEGRTSKHNYIYKTNLRTLVQNKSLLK